MAPVTGECVAADVSPWPQTARENHALTRAATCAVCMPPRVSDIATVVSWSEARERTLIGRCGMIVSIWARVHELVHRTAIAMSRRVCPERLEEWRLARKFDAPAGVSIFRARNSLGILCRNLRFMNNIGSREKREISWRHVGCGLQAVRIALCLAWERIERRSFESVTRCMCCKEFPNLIARMFHTKCETCGLERDVMAHTLTDGQMLLPGIADPHRWDLGRRG